LGADGAQLVFVEDGEGLKFLGAGRGEVEQDLASVFLAALTCEEAVLLEFVDEGDGGVMAYAEALGDGADGGTLVIREALHGEQELVLLGFDFRGARRLLAEG
jgi:hypothetical protein